MLSEFTDESSMRPIKQHGEAIVLCVKVSGHAERQQLSVVLLDT